MDYHAEAEPFTASLPREHALAILEEIDETKDMLWTEGVRGPRAGTLAPRAVGTWATRDDEGRMLCHADQQNQCADSSCSVGAHGFAMMVHDSCHDRSMERPTCSIGGARCSQAEDQEKQHIRQIFAVNTMNFHLVVGTNFQLHTRYCWLSASVMHLLIC